MSMLDDMTKGITDRKAKATGAKLTPVGLEASSTKPSLEPSIPADLPGEFMAQEKLWAMSKDMREKAQQLLGIADALDLYTGGTTIVTSPVPVIADTQKDRERAADVRVAAAAKPASLPELDIVEDESFTDRLNRLSDEAQAAAHADLAGWRCPEHGSDNLKQLESRKGRKYMACQKSGCREYEKE